MRGMLCSARFVQVRQADLAFSTIVIGQKAIHREMGWICAEDQIRPFDCLLLTAVLHQPSRRLAAEMRVERFLNQFAAELAEALFVVPEFLNCFALSVGRDVFP